MKNKKKQTNKFRKRLKVMTHFVIEDSDYDGEGGNICAEGFYKCPEAEQCAIACDGIPECMSGGKKNLSGLLLLGGKRLLLNYRDYIVINNDQ